MARQAERSGPGLSPEASVLGCDRPLCAVFLLLGERTARGDASQPRLPTPPPSVPAEQVGSLMQQEVLGGGAGGGGDGPSPLGAPRAALKSICPLL